ncbi:uncharacterized protein [Montipora foliosa]|uniref:uncharacterized protein n=1 Tax=Montipora foliosa TaxID=591990 RepID=UPI0035F1500B
MATSQRTPISEVVPQDGDLFGPYVINCTVMSFLSLTAIIGNVLILVSICRAPQFLRQPSYVLLINLAFADLCVGFLAEPLYLLDTIPLLINPYSALSSNVGHAFIFISYFLSSLSLWTAAAISVDRLMALHLHMKYSTIVTKFRVCVLVVALLILSSIFASMFEWAPDAQNVVFVCLNSLALLIALLSYTKIFQIVRYHQRQISIQLAELSYTSKRSDNDLNAASMDRQQGERRLEQMEIDGNGATNTEMNDHQRIEIKMKGNGGLHEKSRVTSEKQLQQKEWAPKETLGKANLEKPLLACEDLVEQQQTDNPPVFIVAINNYNQTQRQGSSRKQFTNYSEENRASQRMKTARGKSETSVLSSVVSLSAGNSGHNCIDTTDKVTKSLFFMVEQGTQPKPSTDNMEPVKMTETEFAHIERDQTGKNTNFMCEGEHIETVSSQLNNRGQEFLSAKEGAANIKENSGHSEESIYDRNCLNGLYSRYDQSHVLLNESSRLSKRQETLGEQNEVTSVENNDIVKRSLGNFDSMFDLRARKSPSINTITCHKEAMGTNSVTDGSCTNKCEQNYCPPNENLSVIQSEVKLNHLDEKETKSMRQEDKQYFQRMNEHQNSIADKEELAQSKESNKSEGSLDGQERGCNSQAICQNQTIRRSDLLYNGNKDRPNDNQVTIEEKKGFKMQHFKKSVVNMFVIWFIMLLCYLPLICTSILVNFLGRTYSMHLAFNFSTSVVFVNSSVNPIVFCWRIREFRAAVRKTLNDVFGFWENHSDRNDTLSS